VQKRYGTSQGELVRLLAGSDVAGLVSRTLAGLDGHGVASDLVVGAVLLCVSDDCLVDSLCCTGGGEGADSAVTGTASEVVSHVRAEGRLSSSLRKPQRWTEEDAKTIQCGRA
jgi:hypothetical protein